jgi:uncharacterized protein (TIGR03437 family)
MRFYGAVAAVLAAIDVLAQAPSELTVASATRQRVELAWTPTAQSYSVQRRPLGGTFATIATVTTTTTSDVVFDPHTVYQYQVLGLGSATPSNVVTAGPPPSGFSLVAMAPGAPGTEAAGRHGHALSVALDANGDPALSFVYNDPNGDGDPIDAELRFLSWNRARYRWNPEVRVGVVGITATSTQPSASLAFDPSTNTFAVASEARARTIHLYTSTNGGASWTLKAAFGGDVAVWGPSLALAGGNAHFAYNVENEGIRYLTGRFVAEATSWTTKIAQRPLDTELALPGVPPSLALDSAGAPGIAYWVPPAAPSINRILLFWRPAGTALPVRVMDSQNLQSDQVVAKLAFFGTQPRVAVWVQRRDAAVGVGVHFGFSQDGGATWQTPVVIPPDGNSSTDYPFDLALDSQGRAAIAFGQKVSGVNATCGNPKLSVSTDLTTWRTCAAAERSITGVFGSYPGSVAAIYTGNDKLHVIWRESNANPTGAGLVMWREPLVTASTGPSLEAGTAVNGATFQPGMVPGSWAQVKGANLSDVTRTWAAADFVDGGNLPTTLSGVQVRVNNLPAAVYYIGPAQVSFQVPAGVIGNASVQVIRDGAPSNTIAGLAVANAPGLFGYAAGGRTYAAAVFANSFVVVGDPAAGGPGVRKAVPGDRIQLYATGLEPSPAGVIVSSVAGVSGVTATIGPAPATVEFAGLVGVGLYQINVIVPTLVDGEYPVVIRYAGQSSQPGVMVPIGR